MEITTLPGYAAGVLTTIAFIPQVMRTWKTKSAKDISPGMFVTFCLGVLLWPVYGIMLQSLPVIIANAAVLALAMLILVMKLKY